MNEQDIDQKFDEILMIIYAGKPGMGRNIFANTLRTAVNRKLEQVIAILEQNGAVALIEEIRQIRDG